jgi:biotin-(acetyl-CoA carboxylase) ligase
MRKGMRRAVVTGLVAALLVTTAGTALAADEDSGTEIDLDTLKANLLEKIAERIERFEAKLANLEGEEGVAAEQRTALLTEGIAIFEQLATDVEAATTVDEVKEAARAARKEFRSHRRVRTFYVHIQNDIDKFGRRLGRLEGAIDRAEANGLDTTAAGDEAATADAELAAAQTLLGAVDPSQTGEEVVEDLKVAHRTAHSGQSHIRAGWQELRALFGEAEAA